MIIITNLEENNPQFPLSISGNWQVQILSQGESYELKVMGLTNGFFTCTAPANEIEINDQFDMDKTFQWLLAQMREAVEVSTGESFFDGDLLSEHTGYNGENGYHEADLSGDAMIAIIDEDENWIRFRFHKTSETYFDFLVNKSDAVLAKGIDPSKLLRWLLKKMKEYLCPECL